MRFGEGAGAEDRGDLSQAHHRNAGFGQGNTSGLSHEQETALTYFSEPASIQDVLQVSRYDELDTCKLIAELLEMGLLEAMDNPEARRTPAWNMPPATGRGARAASGPSSLFWPAVVLLIAIVVPLAINSRHVSTSLVEQADAHRRARVAAQDVADVRRASVAEQRAAIRGALRRFNEDQVHGASGCSRAPSASTMGQLARSSEA